MTSRREIHFAVATNVGYLPWAATTVLSALSATHDATTHVWLLHDSDVSREALEKFGAAARSRNGVWHTLPVPSDRLASLPSGVAQHGGYISCARFLLPELMPEVGRVIYLDADTLVLESLTGLVELHTGDALIAAVPNVVLAHHRPRIAELGLDPFRYLNSGVVSMNLDAMRERSTSQSLLDIIATMGERLVWVDQDALNLVFKDDWVVLPARWNAQNSFRFWGDAARQQFPAEELETALADPAVLHFEGPAWAKPWHYLSPHPFAACYRALARSGPFTLQCPTDRTPWTRILRVAATRRAPRAHDWLAAHDLHRCRL